MMTLKKLGRGLRRTQKQIEALKLTAKNTPGLSIDFPLKRLEAVRSAVINEVLRRQNPTNANRSCLPKKQQRKLGLLPTL